MTAHGQGDVTVGRAGGLWILSLMLGQVLAASAQDARTHYWPRRNFDFPIDLEQLQPLEDKPAELALFASYRGGPFREVARYDVNRLPKVHGGRYGFPFEADRDGEYEFTVQFIYPGGRVSPRPDEMVGERRVVIDTIPPTIRIQAAGNGVEWVADDDNLDPRSIILECKFPSDTKWYAVPPVRSDSFQSADRYAWQLRPGQQLDVRVKVKDRAGHEGISRVVRVPAGGSLTSGSDPLLRPGSSDWPPRAPSDSTSSGFVSPQPQIYYVNSLEFNVETQIKHMGRSGIKAAHLFVSEDQRTWVKAAGSPFAVVKKADDTDLTISLPYRVSKEGLYGFIVIPESGAGRRAPDPAPDSAAMVLVEVDTTKPYAKIKSVEVLPGDARGPRVEITWDAADRNLMARPVSLEYALDRNAIQWQPIALQIENNLTRESGRYSWIVPDEKLWKFFVRIRVVDKAANVGEHIYEQEVMVDLEKPEAAIRSVQTVGSGVGSMPSSSGASSRPTPPRPTPKPSPAPPSPPASSSPPAASPPPMIPSPSSAPSLPVPPTIPTPLPPNDGRPALPSLDP